MKPNKKQHQIVALLNAGEVALNNHQLDAAEVHFKAGLKIDARNPEVLLGLAKVQHAKGNPDEARVFYKRAVIFSGQAPVILNAYGLFLNAIGDFGGAIEQFQLMVLSKGNPAPDIHKVALNNLAIAHRAAGRPSAAVALYDEFELLFGASFLSLYNKGNAYEDMGDFGSAIATYQQALKLEPNDVWTWLNLAESCTNSGRLSDADRAFDRAEEISPNNDIIRFARALLKIRRGEYRDGFRDYEARWNTPGFIKSESAQVYPFKSYLSTIDHADDLRGKRVLLVNEQGVGDTIMFLSILSDVSRIAASVTVVLTKRLLRLFCHSFPAVDFKDISEFKLDEAKGFDVVLPTGSLPRLFRPDRASFSGAPYLKPSSAASELFRDTLVGRRPHRLVGITWRGGTTTSRMHHRSLALTQLLPLFRLENTNFVSLQYGDVADEIDQFNREHGIDILHFPKSSLDDFDDFAGLVEQLDCVVSVQNTTVHICGALGKKCLAMIPVTAEWSFGADPHQMAWYQSIQLFRQANVGQWDDVVDAVTCSL